MPKVLPHPVAPMSLFVPDRGGCTRAMSTEHPQMLEQLG